MSMPTLKAQFDASAHAVQALKQRPDNDTLLKLYAYYKQATIGDVSGKRPGLIDFAGRAKYDAWATMKGTPKNDAMQTYIDLVDQLKRAQS
jgi:diazepam-binding inhibitor (GABA receptor modulator, acyl-CoA-binding protein)